MTLHTVDQVVWEMENKIKYKIKEIKEMKK